MGRSLEKLDMAINKIGLRYSRSTWRAKLAIPCKAAYNQAKGSIKMNPSPDWPENPGQTN